MSITPLGVVEKIGEIALKHPEEVQNAWVLLRESLFAEVPELDKVPLPATDETYDQVLEDKRRQLGLDDKDPPK